MTMDEAAALYEDAPCGLMVLDGDGRFLSVNATFLSWFGYERPELLGVVRFQDLLSVGGRIFFHTHIAPLLGMQGSVSEVKLDLKHRDGRLLPVLVNVLDRPTAERRTRRVAVFIAKDRVQYERELVLARERAEEMVERQAAAQRALSVAEARLQVALDSAGLCIWHVDAGTGERHYGHGTASLLGLPADTHVTEALYASSVTPDDREREALAFSAALTAGAAEYRCVYRIDGADGKQRTVLGTGQGVVHGDGRLSEFVGVLHDITDLSLAQTLAEDRALFAEQMVAIVSHDLRNPMTAISLGAEALMTDSVTPRQERLVRQILLSVARSKRLISDLLDFTQVRLGGGMRVLRAAVDIHALSRAALAELRLALPGRQLIHIEQGPGDALADADRVTQFIGNLVSNAAAYGDPAAPITITSSGLSASFCIAVHNAGPSIPAPLLGRIFEPMTRGDQASNGIGLGLFIVSRIVDAHGGHMAVTSTDEEGTTFSGHFAI